MAGISPVPTGRVSDLLLRNRLTEQMRVDQQDLFRIQQQISTGRRLSIPSEDAPAAVRAIGLQRLIERKGQVQVNLKTNQSYLAATDTALNRVSGLLASIRGTAVSVSGTTSTDSQRNAAVLEIQRAIEQLVDVGNQQFRGRYLFAGSNTTERPFVVDNGFVNYNGNESTLSSYADIDLLFETNVNGNEVFGAISDPVLGTTDVQPILTTETRLVDLRSGTGVSRGSLIVSDGTSSSVIDLSGAETVGDVAAMIEASPPTGRTLRVDVTDTGLTVSIDTAGGGNLSVNEVGGGTTAAEFGILKVSGAGTAPIVGSDLDPALKLTTPLQNIMGVRASARLTSSSTDNDLLFEAVNRGTTYNNTTIQFVDDSLVGPGPGLSAGSETVAYSTTSVAARASLASNASANNDILLTATTAGSAVNNTAFSLTTRAADAGGVQITYNAGAKTYSISIEENVSTAADVTTAIQANGTGGGPFTATLDTSVDATNDGSYVFQAIDAAANAGNTGNSGGDANTLFVSIEKNVTTAAQVAAAVTADATVSQLFTARVDIKDDSTKISSGTGTIDISATAQTSGGSGINFDQDSGIQIINAANTYTIDFVGAKTVEDLLNKLNGAGAGVLAEINSTGDGINIRSRVSGADFAIGENGGTTATELGVRSITTTTKLSSLNQGQGVATEKSAFSSSVTAQTPLSQLNQGQGVQTQDGDDLTIRRSDGVNLSINLSAAQTLGDVMDAINNHPANVAGTAQLTAQISAVGNGIEIVEDNPSAASNLLITRDNLSLAAEQLGLIPTGSSTSGPASTPTAATAQLVLAGANNDLLLTAKNLGIDLNNVTVQIVNTGAVSGNSAVVAYNDSDPLLKTLTIDIDPTATTASTVATQIGLSTAPFNVSLPTSFDFGNDGSGLVAAAGTTYTSGGGAGTSVSNLLEILGSDLTIRRSDGVELSIDLSSAQTIGDVMDAINNHPANIGTTAQVTARFSAVGNGLEIIENTPSGAGSLTIIRDNLSLAAENLGLIPTGAAQSAAASTPQAATATLTLSGSNNDLLLTSKDLGITLNSVTVQIVSTGAASGNTAIATYNDSDPLNKTLTLDIDPAATTANTVAQAISSNGGVPFNVILSTTADAGNDGTGLVANVGASFTSSGGAATSIITAELNPLETAGIFNSLARLADALESNDPLQITRAIGLLDVDAERMNLSRAELGARQLGLDVLSQRVDSEVVELTSVLSVEIDVDLASAISEMLGRQAAFQASVQMSARALQITLMDFL